MADVFISHSSIDKELADRVCETLEARGLKCWIAPRDIMPGSEWAVAISNAISVVRAMIVIYSKNSAQSTQVPKEIALAEKRGKFILPYKVDDTELEGAFDYYLTGAHWIVANPEKNDYKFEEMYGVIAGVLQMPAQNITNNLYIDNVTIHSSNVGASFKDDREKATTEKEVSRKETKKKVVTPGEDGLGKKSEKRWFLFAGIILAILLGMVILLLVLLGRSEDENEDADDERTEYEDDAEWDEEDEDREEFDPDDYDSEVQFDENFYYSIGDEGIIISEYVGSDMYVIIPEEVDGMPVREIGEWAFATKNIVSVVIPEGVTSIGYSAFYECSQLTEITLPDSLLTIGEWAFAKTALEEIYIPDGIETLGEFAFQDSENVVVYLWGEAYTYEVAKKLMLEIEE